MASASECPYVGKTLDYTLDDLAYYYYYEDSGDEKDLDAALHNKDCLKTITKSFFIAGETSNNYSPQEQQDFLKEMLEEMGEDIQYIPPGAFAGLNPQSECDTLIAAASDKDVGPLLANNLTERQLEAIPAKCASRFNFGNFHVQVAQRDLWHWNEYYMKLYIRTMPVDHFKYAPKTWVELRFNDKVCSQLDYDQLEALGSVIDRSSLQGAKGINRECLRAINQAAWKGLDDQGGNVLRNFINAIPPTSFTAIADGVLPANVVEHLSKDQSDERNETVSNPCPTNILLNPLEDLAYNADVPEYDVLVTNALKNKDCVGSITRDFFISTKNIPGGPSHEKQQNFLKIMLKKMEANIQHIPPDAFRALDPDDDECDALIEATNDKTVGELLAKHLTGQQMKVIPDKCAWKFSKGFHFELAQRGYWYWRPLFTETVNLGAMSIESLKHAPKGWVELRFDAAVCGKLTSPQLAALGSKIRDGNFRGTKGITNACLKAITVSAWGGITDTTRLDIIVKDLPVAAFNNMDKALYPKVLARLTQDQLAAYDINAPKPRVRCQSLNLPGINPIYAGSLSSECFANALKHSPGDVELDAHFFGHADDNVLEHVDLPTLKMLKVSSGHWGSLQKGQVRRIWSLAEKDITTNLPLLASGFAGRWAHFHGDADFDLIMRMKMDDVQKLPWQMLSGEHVLNQLGSTKIKALRSDILKQKDASTLYGLSTFRAAMTPSQFTTLFCGDDSSYSKCSGLSVSLLADVSRDTLKTLPSACLSKMDWDGLDDGDAKEIVPYLGNKAFEVVPKQLSKHVFDYMRGAQMADFDSKERDDPCTILHLDVVPARLSSSMRPNCFASALRKNKNLPTDDFIRRAGKNLLDNLDPDNAKTLLGNVKIWPLLSGEQLKQMITKDVNYCTLIMAPPPGKSVSLPPLTPECVGLIVPAELVKLLSTSAVKFFQEDSLKAVTSSVTEVEKILKPVAASRPELLKHLGADPESDNPCTLLKIQDVIKDYALAAKYLPKNCYAKMSGLEDIKLADLKKLSEAAQEAIPVKEIIEGMEGNNEFDDLKDSEWKDFMASTAFCKRASKETFLKNKKFVESLSGECYSALSFELEDKETQALLPSTIAQASDDVVAKHVTKYSPTQIGALSTNTKKVASLNALSTEQTAALPVPAIKNVSPGALADLDTAHLQAIPAEVFGALTFDQLAKVPQTVIVTLTPDQARNLGKLVEDKVQDPHRLFNAELHSKLSPELQKLITVDSGASTVRVGVTGMLAVAIATAVVVLA